jgi:membrane protease YdiL (CAAX protease family)
MLYNYIDIRYITPYYHERRLFMKKKFDFPEFLLSVVKCGGYFGWYYLVNIGAAIILYLAHPNEDPVALSTKYSLALTLLGNAVFILSVSVFYNNKSHYSSFAERMDIKPFNFKAIPYIISIAISSLFIVNIIIYSAVSLELVPKSWIDMMDQNSDLIVSGSATMQLLSVGIIGPIAEEVLFRGLMLGGLSKTCDKWLAIFASAIVFGMVHGHPIGIIYASCFGILLGWIYIKTGSLLSVILFHIVYNLLSLYMPEMSPAVFLTITAASFIVFVVCIINIACLPKPTPKNENKDDDEV